MNLFSTHSLLVVRPQPDIAAHRGPSPLSPEALRLWLKGLSASGTTLAWETAGFRLSWSHPHSPVSEANQIDCIRVNFEALAALVKVKPLPCPTPESGSLEEDTPCYHAWWVTKDLNQEEEEPTQTGLFEEAINLEEMSLCFGDTETTGFAHEDRVIQLGLVRVEPNGKVNSYTSYFNPEGRKNNGWTVNLRLETKDRALSAKPDPSLAASSH
jgi:hypothetical protein